MLERVAALLSERPLGWRLLAAAGCVFAASVFGLRCRKRQQIHQRMEEERRRRAESVRRMRGALESFHAQDPGVDTQAVVGLTLLQLAEKLRDGSLTPERVLYSYIEKALQVNDDLNCVTVFLPDCEAQLEGLRGCGARGPLYGIPVSIKEHVGYGGQPSTCGLVQYLDDVEEEDSVFVRVLKKQGAVVFAKTNVPQSLFCNETSNPIYGFTLNPHNKRKGVAGSSGGEGALIGGGASILGIGTDIGGSIRLPASYCGIAGFKPTPNRLSMRSYRHCIDGMFSVPFCIGPMARDVDSLVYTMKALWCDEMFHLDTSVPPLYFNEKTFSAVQPLRIGFYEEDGFFQPNPSMRRVLRETKQLLAVAGHQLIPFRPPRVEDMMEIYFKATLGDGGRTLAEKFENNIVDPNLAEFLSSCRMPTAIRRLLAFILRPLYPRISRLISASYGVRSVKDYWANDMEMERYRTEFISEWRKLRLDVVLCPMLGPAFNHGYPGHLYAPLSYTMLYNLLSFPAGVVPVGSVSSEDEEELKRYSGYSNDPWDKLFKKALAGGVGLPLSVQCAALPYQDELCLRLMKEVETLTRHKT